MEGGTDVRFQQTIKIGLIVNFMYSDYSFIRTRLFPVDISGLTSFLDY